MPTPFLCLASVLAACGAAPAVAPAEGMPVVAAVTQVAALARAVGGTHIRLTALLRSADDPHSYAPHPSDVRLLATARLIIRSGAGLDGWIDRPLAAVAPRALVVDASRGAHLRTSAQEGTDPHWWYDVDNAATSVDTIAAALAGADPGNRAAYLANAAAQKARLRAADAGIHALVDPIPPGRRLFVANHDAFNYFLARYGITLVGDIIPSTDSLAAVRPRDMATLISAMRRGNVRAIFTETTLDTGLAAQVARETGAAVFAGRLYGDAIGDPGSAGETLEGALMQDARLMAQGFNS